MLDAIFLKQPKKILSHAVKISLSTGLKSFDITRFTNFAQKKHRILFKRLLVRRLILIFFTSRKLSGLISERRNCQWYSRSFFCILLQEIIRTWVSWLLVLLCN